MSEPKKDRPGDPLKGAIVTPISNLKTEEDEMKRLDAKAREAGLGWLVDAKEQLGLQDAPGAVTRYLPSSNAWADYVPPGLVAESYWDDFWKAAEASSKPKTEDPRPSSASMTAD